jgi:hypothetical protein
MNDEEDRILTTEITKTEIEPAQTNRVASSNDEHDRNVFERFVWYVAGTIIVLLGLRFLLALLGANTTNAIADAVYSFSKIFVAPFFNLFSYDNIQYGVSRFELYTLVAMIFYALVAWGLVKLVNINRK